MSKYVTCITSLCSNTFEKLINYELAVLASEGYEINDIKYSTCWTGSEMFFSALIMHECE